MDIKKLLIASNNKDKAKEMMEILPFADLEVIPVSEFNLVEPEEDGRDFLENAIIKAKYYGNKTNLPALADDSGIIFTQLGKFPGINSKRFAEECGGFKEAMSKVSKMLQTHPIPHPAKFVCGFALYLPNNGQLITAEGVVEGEFVYPPRGENGFGFDPIFVPEGHTETFAELSPVLKNKISHRTNAMKELINKIRHLFESNGN